ncbi:MAG TPA: hypothetical protein VGJ01_15490 [Pseudolabrys sp.]|jgi:hypothetical protein
MRFATWLAGGALALGLTTAAFADDAASSPPDNASQYCGFHDKAGAEVQCGYSNVQDCEKALDNDKDAVCVPDPAFGFNTVSPPQAAESA